MSSGRALFLAALRRALDGAPESFTAATLADFGAHFDEGRAAGRTDAEIASALGDPGVLGEQLATEADLAEWERSRSARSGFRLIVTGLRRAALVLLTPFIALIAAALAALVVITILILFGAGVWMFARGDLLGLPGDPGASMLAAAALLFAAVSLAAASALGAHALVTRIASRLRRRQRLTASFSRGLSTEGADS